MSVPSQNAIAVLTGQRRLLELEYREEREAFTRLTRRIGAVRLEARGDAWLDVVLGRSYYNSLNRRVVELTRRAPEDGVEDDHNFEYGRAVSIFHAPADGPLRHLVAGTVSYVDGLTMAVVIPDSTDLDRWPASGLGVMVSFDETTYRTMFEALDQVMKAKGRLGELRDLIYSSVRAPEHVMEPMSFPYLNESQQTAVNKVLRARDVAVVHGPPGTGKTTTLVEAIHETIRREPQVMVCAQSNMAVDWICEKLRDRGVKVLRLGNPSRVNDNMLACTYERRFEAHPDYASLWAIRREIRQMQAAGRRTDAWHRRLDNLRERAAEIESRINSDLFASVNVIASTLVGSASRLLVGMKFSTVFIDEAAQALEAAAWIPMRRAGRLILAGDHCQLPPTIKSYEAMKAGLGVSLMERIVTRHPEAVTLLTVQYRMNDDIMRLPNEWFYAGAMQADPGVRHRGILEMDRPIEWIDTAPFTAGEDEEPDAFREATVADGYGRVNRDEALLTLAVLERYIRIVGERRFLDEKIDVGLISPYRAQVRYLRQVFARTPFFRPFRRAVSINTIDGFQGQERDVIVVSMVRSNDAASIGFLRDLRRMNVAMTRARMKLIIIGDVSTLVPHPFYRRLHVLAES